jgi:GTP cyclohydrolase I
MESHGAHCQDAVRTLLSGIGENPTRPGLLDTPRRVVDMYREMTSGYQQDPATILARMFDDTSDEMVVLEGIEFTSLCEHHLLPFVGTATVGYVPDKQVVGISKLARLVECYARRLQVQERMTKQIADAIMEHLKPQGAAVLVKARHSCMGCRGVRKPSALMTTSALRGVFMTNQSARAEFLSLCNSVLTR